VTLLTAAAHKPSNALELLTVTPNKLIHLSCWTRVSHCLLCHPSSEADISFMTPWEIHTVGTHTRT
jgi:hypothetical protein